ncbi:MAG TPA: hypothetical protein VLT86_15435 [Vicinamibacterales bacterium]|nr:hypothetical protein [Vicinamibacterales bacterium]
MTIRRSGASTRPAVWLTSVALAAAIVGHPSGQKLDDSAKALAARAAKYVADYQTKFSFLVASETYTQVVTSAAVNSRRVMHGELFLTFLRTDREWIAVHDVADVDGQPVPNREDLQALLQRADVSSVAQRVANRNAAFNIGSVSRNFNEPTLALLVLEAKRIAQFRFVRKARVERDGATLATLAFTEHDGPTLVKGDGMKSVFSRGEFVVEVASGRIRRSVISFDDGPMQASLTTDYMPEDRLALWVPSTFVEHYDLNDRKLHEQTTCSATYSNYRRFEVTGRIK